MPEILLSDRVRHMDGDQAGTVVRLIGRKNMGSGISARVRWDSGGESVVTCVFLVKVDW